MRQMLFGALVALVVSAAIGSSRAATGDDDVIRQARDRTEIEALMWRYVRALDTNDAEAYAAVYTPDGQKQVREAIDFYMENARIIREGLAGIGLEVYGARNAPYIWVKTPKGLGSWAFFDKLLNDAHVVGTPGAGFGPSGEGYLRLTAFGQRADTVEEVQRITTRLSL